MLLYLLTVVQLGLSFWILNCVLDKVGVHLLFDLLSSHLRGSCLIVSCRQLLMLAHHAVGLWSLPGSHIAGVIGHFTSVLIKGLVSTGGSCVLYRPRLLAGVCQQPIARHVAFLIRYVSTTHLHGIELVLHSFRACIHAL